MGGSREQTLSFYAMATPFMVLLFILPYPGTVALRLVCLALLFMVAMFQWRKLAPPRVPCKPAFAVWAAVAIASIAYSVDRDYSLGEVKNEIGYTLMAFAGFFAFTSDQRRFKWMLTALCTGAVVLCLWVLLTHLRAGFWEESLGHGGMGTYATYMIMMVPAIALLGLYFEDPRLRRLSLGLLALMLVVGFLSHQRIIWPVLGLQIAVGLFLYRRPLRLSWTRVLGFCLVAAFIAVALVALTQSTRYKPDDPPATRLATDIRLGFWPKVAERILEHPGYGAGFGRRIMSKAYPDLVPPESPVLWHAHNFVLNYGIQMGLPGIAALLFLFGALLWAYAKLWQLPNRQTRLIAACGMALVIGVFARNMGNDFFVRDSAILFWAMNGLMLGFGLRLGANPAASASDGLSS